MQIHELYTSSEAWQNALGTSLRYQVPKIFPLSSTLYILERVAGKICIHLSQFSETDALCSKLCRHNPADPIDAADGTSCRKVCSARDHQQT